MVRPAGVIDTGDEEFSLRVTGAFRPRRTSSSTTSSPTAGCCACATSPRCARGYADPPQPMFRVNGKPAIGLAIAMRDGGDILALGRTSRPTIAGDPRRPARSASSRSWSPTSPRSCDEAIGEFTGSLWQAIAIILAVSFVSLGLRAGLVVALSIPLMLAIVFPIM